MLRLSRGMTYKNAVADLELGGGKSVIIGDARTQKSPALFEAFGRALETLGGIYYAAEDVGVSPSDLVATRTQTKYVVGLEGFEAASGDPSPVTAEGVFRGIRIAARHGYGADISGMTVAVQGVGHVGGYLCDKLHAAGAKLIITDVNQDTLRAVADRTGAVIVAPDDIAGVDAEIFAPCALGCGDQRRQPFAPEGQGHRRRGQQPAGHVRDRPPGVRARCDLRARLRDQRRRHHQCRLGGSRPRARRGL